MVRKLSLFLLAATVVASTADVDQINLADTAEITELVAKPDCTSVDLTKDTASMHLLERIPVLFCKWQAAEQEEKEAKTAYESAVQENRMAQRSRSRQSRRPGTSRLFEARGPLPSRLSVASPACLAALVAVMAFAAFSVARRSLFRSEPAMEDFLPESNIERGGAVE